MRLLDPMHVNWVVLHCSASPYGNLDIVEEWHQENGWLGIGYHWLITNCYSTEEDWIYGKPDPSYDGLVHKGRDEKFQGAHVKGHNWETIGVCLIGGEDFGGFTSRQLESSVKLCNDIMQRYPSIQGVKGHYEFPTLKTCPDIDMGYYRNFLLHYTNLEEED